MTNAAPGWIISRRYCRPCNRLGKVVAAEGADIRCPSCGGVTETASGPDAACDRGPDLVARVPRLLN